MGGGRNGEGREGVAVDNADIGGGGRNRSRGTTEKGPRRLEGTGRRRRRRRRRRRIVGGVMGRTKVIPHFCALLGNGFFFSSCYSNGKEGVIAFLVTTMTESGTSEGGRGGEEEMIRNERNVKMRGKNKEK